MTDTVFVHFSWDSGPYPIFYESRTAETQIERPGGYGHNTVAVPRELWERYEAAQGALYEAENALEAAGNAAIEVARQDDPRWQESLAS